MNIQSKYPTTADEFLRWNEGREGKREFVDGRVVEMMINVTEGHYRLAARLVLQLGNQLSDEDFIVGSADFGVRTAGGVRYPDVMVHLPGNNRDLATTKALFVAEILSPSSMADDFGPKAQAYLALDTLRHYLVLAQDEMRIWLWSRRAEGGWDGPAMIDHAGELVQLSGLGVSLDIGRLYAGIAPASDAT
jgi:Uma2 family endonuclease